MLAIADPDARQIFLRDRSGIARNDEAQREAMQGRDILAIHRPGDQSLRLHGLLDRHAAREHFFFRIAGYVDIIAIMAGIDSGRLHASLLQHVPQTNARPLRAADSAHRPLIARGAGVEECPAIAAAFQHQRQRHILEAALQLVNGQRKFVFDLAVNHQRPSVRIPVQRRLRHETIIADE